MRKGFSGLTHLTREQLGSDPLSGDIFLFINRKGDYLKALLFDRTGFCIVAKRLERGRFLLPCKGMKIELESKVFSLLFDGIAVGERVRVK